MVESPTLSGSAALQRPAIGVVRESNDGERRVALVPKVVASLIARGVDVVVESGAGLGALIPDELYKDAGATIADP
ncbi:NAD(P)(+) transhydrogenase (Re/Si-specific) subunit alpha, partial [Rhodococcus koreensis]